MASAKIGEISPSFRFADRIFRRSCYPLANDAHRPPRRLLQPRPSRPPPGQRRGDPALGLDEMWWLVSPGNPLKPAEGHGAARRPARLGAADGPRPADPGHGDRARARHPLHGRHARRPDPPLPGPALHLADGRGQSRPVPPLAPLAQDRRTVPIAVVSRPGYDGPAHAARAMGWLRRFVHPADQARELDGVENAGARDS